MGARLRDIAEGRRDALNVDPKQIRIEKGFNPRDYALGENREHLDELKASIRLWGVKVPLLVRWDVGTEQAILIDGECRLRACLELIEEGIEIKSVPVLQEAAGNEADRLLLAITTNTGKPLSVLESGAAFRRLMAFGWSKSEVAEKTGRSVQFVGKALDLADAPQEVREMVEKGTVTPALARKAVKERGDGAGAALRERVEEAKAKGKNTAVRPREDKLLDIGDKMADEILAEHGSFDEMAKFAKRWKRMRQ